MRLAQQPNIPDILEDPEPDESPANDHRQCNGSDVSKGQFGRNAFVTKAKPRNSSSRLPVPSRVSSPPPVDAELVSEETHGKKKLTRRPSGLMTLNGHRLRPPTPTFGAPVDLADLGDSDEDGEEFTRALCTESERESGTGKESGAEEVKRKRKERSTKAGEDEEDAACTSDKKEKKRAKDKDGLHVNRLKDVTNSPRRKRRSGSVTDSASEGMCNYYFSSSDPLTIQRSRKVSCNKGCFAGRTNNFPTSDTFYNSRFLSPDTVAILRKFNPSTSPNQSSDVRLRID